MKVSSVLSVLLVAALMSSCGKVDFKKTKGGMPYKLFTGKEGQPAAQGNVLKVHYSQTIKDSSLFSSYNSMPVYIPVNPSSRPYDISELFPMLKKGDSVYAVQMMDSFIKQNPSIVQQTPYRNGDKIITTIKVLEVFKDAQASAADEQKEKQAFLNKEDEAVKAYLSKNKINAQKVGSGTYVEILDPGTGAQADSGKYVSVMYKGSTFRGTVFDSNMDATFKHTDPLGFVVGTQGMIKGMDEGIRLLKKGGHGRFYIPSTLAYGGQAPSPDIKPFEHLIFEVQVVDVLDKAPAPQMPPQGANVDPGQAPR
jgi:FKBP-type peptidyl-prolyl cis-trans isomerase